MDEVFVRHGPSSFGVKYGGSVVVCHVGALADKEGGDGKVEMTDDADGKALLRSQLSGRRVLVVLDDVWESCVVEDVLPASMGLSRALITTRNKDTLPHDCPTVDIAKAAVQINPINIEKYIAAMSCWDLIPQMRTKSKTTKNTNNVKLAAT